MIRWKPMLIYNAVLILVIAPLYAKLLELLT